MSKNLISIDAARQRRLKQHPRPQPPAGTKHPGGERGVEQDIRERLCDLGEAA